MMVNNSEGMERYEIYYLMCNYRGCLHNILKLKVLRQTINTKARMLFLELFKRAEFKLKKKSPLFYRRCHL